MDMIHRGKVNRMGKTKKKWLKRRQAGEPAPGT